jgi:hypothetical protein
MKKALTTSEVIAIVFAVIIIAALLYFLWAKGLLPFTWGISESDCKRTLLQFCSGQIPVERLNIACAKYFYGVESDYKDCVENKNPDSDTCRNVCSWAYGLG